MNRWKITTLGLILLSLIFLILAARLDLNPYQHLRAGRAAWMEGPRVHQDLKVPVYLSQFSALLTLYLSGIVFLFLFPRRIRKMSETVFSSWNKLLRIFFLGLLAQILAVAAGVGSSLTMATFPLAIFLASVLFISAIFGSTAVAYVIGKTLLVRSGWSETSPLIRLLAGVVILFAAINLPYAGPVILMILVSSALGASLASRFGSGQPWSLITLIEEGKE